MDYTKLEMINSDKRFSTGLLRLAMLLSKAILLLGDRQELVNGS
jgi:hypothetical protein